MLRARLETVKDDATECWIFPQRSKPSGDEDMTYMTDFLTQVRATVSDLTRNYLWHKDAFNVHQPITQNDELPPHLYSLTYYGDNVEDEWFIVYVLREVTRRHAGAVARVRDNDGEFLLIEAADALPAWATPDTTENRVYIFNGNIHLITPSLFDVKKTVSVREAVESIKKYPDVTKSAENIQVAINKRIQDYPQRIMDNLHRTTLRLPARFVAILKIEPALIAQSVNAYCSRDKLESNICKNLELVNFIDTSVTFTKCLYAMLIHASLINIPSWKLPAKSSNEYKKNTLGVKVACGFEILMSKASQDTFAGKQWKIYLESLKKNGYFKDNIEGSKEYTRLLETAKEYFLTNECSNMNAHIGNTIQQIMSGSQFEETFKSINETADGLTGDEDSDDWLNVKSEDLDNMMSERYGKKNFLSKGDIVTPQTITAGLSSFLKQSSDLEGIEVYKEEEEEVDDQTTSVPEDRIDFDYQQFTEQVKNILDLVVPEDNWNLDSGTDLSDYGSDDDLTAGVELTQRYQQEMDQQLSTTTLAQSFVSDGNTVNISENTIVNLLQSMKEEMGSSGPSSTLLANIGISKNAVIPLDSDDEDDE